MEKFIDLVIEAHKKIDFKQIQKEKYNLIKTIQESFNIDEFLNSPIPNYKTYASIYKLFESKRQDGFDIKDELNVKIHNSRTRYQ